MNNSTAMKMIKIKKEYIVNGSVEGSAIVYTEGIGAAITNWGRGYTYTIVD